MNFNENFTRKVKISSSSLSLLSSAALAIGSKATTDTNVETTTFHTATTGNCNNVRIFIIKKIFIFSFNISCASFTIYYSAMPTSPHDMRCTQLNCSMGMCEARIQTTTTAVATPRVSTQATLRTVTHEHENQEQKSSRTRTARTDIPEVMLPSLTSVSFKQTLKGWVCTLMGKVVEENIQASTHRTDIPKSLRPPLQQSLSAKATAAEITTKTTKRATSYVPILATTAAAEKTCSKQCLSIKMPLRQLILTIMTVVVFAMEFTICASTSLQQQLTTMTLLNNTHLPTETANKSTKINDNLQNLPVTLTTTAAAAEATTITTVSTMISTVGNSFLFPSSMSPSSATTTSAGTSSISSPPPSLPVTALPKPLLKSMETAALVQKLPSSLTASTLDDSLSNLQSFMSGLASETPAHSSLHWDGDESKDDSSELSHSTSILNTYDPSDLPPLSEAEQAAKDLLTKGFSIPTYLPPFPVFAVADLPKYLNTVSTTTTESPISHLHSSDGYGANSQENLLYFNALSNHQRHGQHQNHHKLQIARKNSSMASPNVTVQVGNHAYLPCHIHRLQNKPVSWVRLRDGHIISVDQTTFIADQRFQAIFQDDKELTWSLQIKYVQEIDEGWYECQASSEPKMSAKIFLKVVVPTTELIGDQSRFVKAGSKVALHCIVRGTLVPPQYIIWYRDKIQISDNNKMGWFTQLDRDIFGNKDDKRNTIGSLIIPFVRKMDSGNYTCQPSNSASVSVDLHVLSGEYSASAIMSAARAYTLNDYYLLLLLFLLMLLHRT